MGALIGFATSKLGLSIFAVLGVMLFLGLHLAGDSHVKHQRDAYKLASEDWKASSTAYERGYRGEIAVRAAEWQSAKDGAQSLDKQCAARVAEAHRSSNAIRDLLSRPPKVDPVTKCAVPEAIPAADLHGALGI